MIPIYTSTIEDAVSREELSEEEQELLQDHKIKAYFEAFQTHFKDIHWSAMDITRAEVCSILGYDGDMGDSTIQSLLSAETLSDARRSFLAAYIERHEDTSLKASDKFFNS